MLGIPATISLVGCESHPISSTAAKLVPLISVSSLVRPQIACPVAYPIASDTFGWRCALAVSAMDAPCVGVAA